ncbi:MAG TPA: hypothetical protein VK816_03465 [Jatrophihabitantaceae bacterium]|jgi:hypothetical protein|nr:hypothetical protein [Jatrophihabitantaceae bacterium]
MNRASPHRRRTSWLAAGAAIIVALAALGYIAVDHWHRKLKDTAWVTLTTGTYKGVVWKLDAQEYGGRLCLSLDDAKGGGDRGAAEGGYSAGCGFDDKETGQNGDLGGGMGPVDSQIDYGPLPSNATQIRIATNKVIPTGLLPTGKGLPAGRYWVFVYAPDWLTPAVGKPLDPPQPLNARGKPVAYKNF